MYNNPKGIVIYKDGESLTDLAKRIMGAKIDSLGIALDQDRSVYESKPFWITGDFDQPGHAIFDVQLTGCNADKKIALGSLFGEYGCNKESLLKLKSLSAGSNSDIKEMCHPAEMDEAQKVWAYADTKKEIYWGISGDDIASAGVYKGSIPMGEFGVMPCDKASREKYKIKEAKRIEDENKWYIPNVFLGKYVGGCKENRSPGDVINGLDLIHEPYEISGEVKQGDRVMQTTIEYINRGGSITYFRGKERCEAAANQQVSNQDQVKKSNQNKYK